MNRAWNFKDLTGQRFGRLTVIEYDHTRGKHAYWKCRCDCGNYSVVMGKYLSSGKTKSCGCLMRERAAEHMKEVGRKYGSITGKENLKKALAEGKGTTGKGTANGNYKHGMTGTRLYSIYHGMKERCLNPKYHAYPDYGGRGITVCKEWQEDFQEFANWALTHGYADNLTIERKDVNGNYEPGNCTWITNAEQQKNKRNTKKKP